MRRLPSLWMLLPAFLRRRRGVAVPAHASVAALVLVTCFLHVCPDSVQIAVSDGEDVNLSCNYTKEDLSTDPTVIWENQQGQTLLKLKNGKAEEQHVRVSAFGKDSVAGDFSIQIKNVTQKDTGTYTCHIEEVHYIRNVRLIVNQPVRLVGGANRCEGTVEAELGGEWRRVMTLFDPWNPPWGLWAAAALCQALGCGSAVSTEEREGLEDSEVWGVFSDCVKRESSVRHCLRSDRSTDGLRLVCSGSVRLVSGQTSCSGSVQFRDQSLDQWRPLCQEEIDSRGAEVLCRELGCGAPLLQGALSPLGQTFHCEGNESALMDCPRNQTRTDPETCPALSLSCSEPLRLVGGANRCEGTVEAELKGEWRRVMRLGPRWELWAAVAVCRDLGCGSAVSTAEKREGFDNSEVWAVYSTCVNESSVRDCLFPTGSNNGLLVACAESVRLVSGQTSCSGSVQFRDQSLDQWRPLCQEEIDSRGAEVLCRELGCGAPLLQGALSPLGQTFHCEGNESALMDCPRNQTRTDPETCPALSLSCTEPLRLVGGANHCEGTVEAELRREWRRVAADPRWNLETAAAVCQALGCGSAVSTEQRRDLDDSEVWYLSSDCVRRESSVRDCFIGLPQRSDVGQLVVCSGTRGPQREQRSRRRRAAPEEGANAVVEIK